MPPSWLPAPARAERLTCTARPMACPESSAASIRTGVWLWKSAPPDINLCWLRFRLLVNFTDCTLIAPITTPFNIQNDETSAHRSIYLCPQPLLPGLFSGSISVFSVRRLSHRDFKGNFSLIGYSEKKHLRGKTA